MRKLILAMVVALIVALAAGIAIAQAEPEGGGNFVDRANDGMNRCEGTGQPDFIVGSPGRDIIVAKEGDDLVVADQGGRDDVFGNKNNDTIDVKDGEGNDFVDCGEGGDDQAFGDRGDKFRKLRRQRLPRRHGLARRGIEQRRVHGLGLRSPSPILCPSCTPTRLSTSLTHRLPPRLDRTDLFQ